MIQISSGRQYAENITALHSTANQLAQRPESVPMYMLRLYVLSLERSSIIAQLEVEEKHALDAVQTAYEEERERVEDEWKRGRDRVRERLVEGIEERRRRAREEKEGEGTVGGNAGYLPLYQCRVLTIPIPADASLDAQSRPHITRKLRNKLGTSPPPTPLIASNAVLANGLGYNTGLPITTGPFTNPHSLAVDELPSPFPLPLTSTTLPSGHGGSGGPAGAGAGGIGNGSRRRAKGTGIHQSQAGIGGLGKSLAMLAVSKETEIEADLGEIRRGNKRRRASALTLGKNNT